MKAMLTQPTEPVPEIIDFVAFRGAVPRRSTPDAKAPAAAVIVAFPAARARPVPHTVPHTVPGGNATHEASDLSVACALLVDSFRAMHEAVTELQESCRVLDSNADDMHDQAGAVLIGIAQLSSTTERFQDRLDATIDAAFS
jgi:hypothetical protein